MATNMPHGRAALERLEIDHDPLTDREVFHLSAAVRG